MNCSTRLLFDVILLDPWLEHRLDDVVMEERRFWIRMVGTDTKKFLQSIIPGIIGELQLVLDERLRELRLSFLRPYINLNSVDYHSLIPVLSTI